MRYGRSKKVVLRHNSAARFRMCSGEDSAMTRLIGWKRFPASGSVTAAVTTYASAALGMGGLVGCEVDFGDLPRSSLESLNIGLMCRTGCM